MRYLIFQVIVGDYNSFFEFCAESVNRYCKKYNIDHVIQRTPILKITPHNISTEEPIVIKNNSLNFTRLQNIEKLGYWPEFERFNGLSFYDRYENICILDADIFIKESAPNIFEDFNDDAAFVYTLDQPWISENNIKNISRSFFKDYHRVYKTAKIPFQNKFNVNCYDIFNNSLMLFNSNFLKKQLNNRAIIEWLKENNYKLFVGNLQQNFRQAGIGTDIFTNYFTFNIDININRLDWKWNLEYNDFCDKPSLEQSYFIHFIGHKNFLNKNLIKVLLQEKTNI